MLKPHMETQLVYPPEATDIDELRDGWLKPLFTQTGASSFTHIREKTLQQIAWLLRMAVFTNEQWRNFTTCWTMLLLSRLLCVSAWHNCFTLFSQCTLSYSVPFVQLTGSPASNWDCSYKNILQKVIFPNKISFCKPTSVNILTWTFYYLF